MIQLPQKYSTSAANDLSYLENSAQSGTAIFKTGIRLLDYWTDGGFAAGSEILLASRQNMGKSACLINILKGLIDNNDNTIVLSFALDDTKMVFLSRWLASMAELPIKLFRDAKCRNEAQQQAIEHVQQEFLSTYANRMLVFESSDINARLDQLRDRVQAVYHATAEASGTHPQIIVSIDSSRNLDFSHIDGLSANATALTEFVGRRIKDMLSMKDGEQRIEPIIICTEHVKKYIPEKGVPNPKKRPTPDDIKDSIGPLYDANLILMLWNDLNFSTTVLRQTSDMKFAREDLSDPRADIVYDPVVELTLAKNKLGRMNYSAGADTCFFKFYQEQSRMEQITERNEHIAYAQAMR